jgi:ketosteroid isomerase-like protein
VRWWLAPPPRIKNTDQRIETAELTQVACESGRAYAVRDLSALDRLTASDYVQTDVRGGILKRAQWLEFVRDRKSELAVECENVDVRIYGEAAVVTGRWIYIAHKAVGDVVTHSRWTSVWTKYPDGWKRHVFQNTYENVEADRCVASGGRSAANSGSP